jgi:hypothetical protein
MNRSPERGSFQIEGELKKVEEGKKTLEAAQEMIDLYKSWEQERLALEETDEWKQDNMEYDLRSTKWICDKAKDSEVYAQNLYAAMCNNEFIKNDVWPLLSDKRWSCSWRSAGGIIANMIEKGDYIDWYCSGIYERLTENQLATMEPEEVELYKHIKATIMPESVVTDEIRSDLLKLGWIVVQDDTTD